MQLFRRRATGDKRDNRAFIVDSYRTILGREPDKVGMLYFSNLLENHQLDRLGVLKAILSSEEAQSRTGGATKELVQAPPGCLRSEAEAVFANFEKYRGTGRPGFVTNFLGGLTDVRFVAGIEFLAGVVEGYPIPGNFHGDVLEWVGTLRATLEAKEVFTMLELGAGWAPWCVIGYLSAKQRKIEEIQTIAVEGDPGHVAFARDSFATNSLGADEGKIIHGIVGTSDGYALFPKAIDASRNYGNAALPDEEKHCGASADFATVHSDLVEEVQRLPCFGLASLMKGHSRINLVHCDIQGAEYEVFNEAMGILSAKVKRVVVGTHSFEIDRQLACLFAKNDWNLEGINACRMTEQGGKPVIFHDGVQVWRNSRF
jgi:FkbM family methyltransferase